MTTADVPVFYRCPRCNRPVSPWTPETCSRCRGQAEREAFTEWVEDNCG